MVNSLSYSPSPQKTSMNPTTDVSSTSKKAAALSPLVEGDLSDDESHLTCGSFENVTGTEKENSASTNFWNGTNSIGNSVETNESAKEHVRNMRLQTRSPLRRDLVKKTQDAINKASASVSSVNQTLLAARQAKEESHRQKGKQTARIRKEWKGSLTRIAV